MNARENARAVLLTFVSYGVITSTKVRDRLWEAAEVDEDFREQLRAAGRTRDRRDADRAEGLAALGRRLSGG